MLHDAAAYQWSAGTRNPWPMNPQGWFRVDACDECFRAPYSHLITWEEGQRRNAADPRLNPNDPFDNPNYYRGIGKAISSITGSSDF